MRYTLGIARESVILTDEQVHTAHAEIADHRRAEHRRTCKARRISADEVQALAIAPGERIALAEVQICLNTKHHQGTRCQRALEQLDSLRRPALPQRHCSLVRLKLQRKSAQRCIVLRGRRAQQFSHAGDARRHNWHVQGQRSETSCQNTQARSPFNDALWN
ncbi:hypothetical protein HC891_09860 [Candidatus Gracilibacteria bacterium]|nr:hypothetical protein [Candidatus Gracilibacteria bacterium]